MQKNLLHLVAFKEVQHLPPLWDTVSFWLVADPWICFTGASIGLSGRLFLFWNAKIWLPHQICIQPALVWLRSWDNLKAFIGIPSLCPGHAHKRSLFQATWAPVLHSQNFTDVIYQTKDIAFSTCRLQISFSLANPQISQKRTYISILGLSPL